MIRSDTPRLVNRLLELLDLPMSWPLISDFSRMLQNPKIAFRDPALRGCSIETDHLGQPKPRSGNFATVYRAEPVDEIAVAVRVFNRRSDHRLEHYQAVSRYLETRAVSCLVGFEYHEKGIRSAADGKLYPLLTMQWVPGVTLFEWARARCHEGYRQALEIGAEAWLQLVRELAAHKIVHGDLQHGNVLVSSEGYFKLVDYDGMSVPELFGTTNPEVGLEPYQHPGRDSSTLAYEGLDNFSALFIYVALRALAAAPELWVKYVDNLGYDKLLFRPEDFANPQGSALYQELLQSPDHQVRELTHYLFSLRNFPLHDVPPIDEVLLWCNSIGQLVAAKDWDTMVALVERMGPNEKIPANLQADVDLAYRRVACRRELEAALALGDEDEVCRIYDAQLLDDYPAAAALAEQAKAAFKVKHLLAALETARRFGRWDVFSGTWVANQPLLEKRVSAAKYKDEIKKLHTFEAIRVMLEDESAEDQAILQAWDHLQSLGGHEIANALDLEIQRRKRRLEAAKLYRKLTKASPTVPTVEFDQRLVTAWNEDLLSNWRQANALADFHKKAKKRLQGLRRIQKYFKECTYQSEKKIAKVADILSHEYHSVAYRRARKAQRRIAALEQLNKGFADPMSDLDIGCGWSTLCKLEAQSLVAADRQERIEIAVRRLPTLKILDRLASESPSELRDSQWIEAWDPELLEACPDVKKWEPLITEARERIPLVQQLRSAVEQGDDSAVERLKNDPLLKNFTLSEELADAIDDLPKRHEQLRAIRLQSLKTALRDADREKFADHFDEAFLREICQQSPHHQPLVSRMTESEILSLERLGLVADEATALKRLDDEQVCATWSWPPKRMVSACRLIVSPERLKPTAHPDDVANVHDVLLAADQWNVEQGYRFTPKPQGDAPVSWDGYRVTVWAVIDLGYQTYYSTGVDLGCIEAAQKSKRWRLFGNDSGG